MSVTEASLEANFNTYIGDSSVDRISAAERLQLATESTVWLQQETGNDHMVKTYSLKYYDNVHYYKVTSVIASLLEGADLRRGEKDQTLAASHLSTREIAEDIAQNSTQFAWAIERRDADTYLVVNLDSKYAPQTVADMDSISAGGGTWAVDAVNSDATNLTVDTNEFKQGTASLNFDITVAQSANNRATLTNSTLNQLDLSNYVDLGAWIFWVYLPTVTNFSSITLYWGSDSSNYYSATVTTDITASAWAAGWNRVAVLWQNATATGTPVSTAIDYMRIDYNYTGSQANDTDYRLDDLTIVRPETLTYFYTSWYVGTDTTGVTQRTAFAATSDIPYFSGQYDQYKYAVSHKMASIAFYGPLQAATLGQLHEVEAIKALNRVKKLIPQSVTKTSKTFKVSGIGFGRVGSNRIPRRITSA